MGAVYEAIDERLDKTVAIKEILLDLENASDKKQQELIKQAFRREANSLVKARHEAVPDVTDYFSEFDREFLVMEFIEGEDLMKMLQVRNKPFLLEEISLWIDQLLVALHYLHNLKPSIIHRDIKPQNLKVNQWGKIKLLDFGVAKNNDKAATVTQMTFVGATLSYSPIEQILRVIDPMFRALILLQHREKAEKVLAQTTDARCDIYAIGATFYHLLTNQAPVDVTKRALEFWEGKGDPLVNPSKLNPVLSAKISAWLIKAMAIEREYRFSSAIEMRKAFHEAISQNQAESTSLTDQDKELMQAQTVRLIEIPEIPELKKDTKENIPLAKPGASDSESFDTFSSPQAGLTDFEFTKTDFSKPDTSEDLGKLTYTDDKYTEQQNITVVNEIKPETAAPPRKLLNESATRNVNYLMILPIVGVLVFIVFGGGIFGIYMLMNYSGSDNNDKSVIENNSNTAGNPAVTTSVDSNLNNNTEKTAGAPDATGSKDRNTVSEPPSSKTPPPVTRPTATTTRNPVVVNTPPKPVATPAPARKAEPPPPKKPKLTDDCIYNRNCE